MKTSTQHHPSSMLSSIVSAVGGIEVRYTPESDRDEWIRDIDRDQKRFRARHGLSSTPTERAAAHSAAILEVERRLAPRGRGRQPVITGRQLASIADAHTRAASRVTHPGVTAAYLAGAAAVSIAFAMMAWWGWFPDLSYYDWPAGTSIERIKDALSSGTTVIVEIAAWLLALVLATSLSDYWIPARAHRRSRTPLRHCSVLVAHSIMAVAAPAIIALGAYLIGVLVVFGRA